MHNDHSFTVTATCTHILIYLIGGAAKPTAVSTAAPSLTLGGGSGGLFSGQSATSQPSTVASTAPAASAQSTFNKGLDGQVKTTSLAQSSDKPTSR